MDPAIAPDIAQLRAVNAGDRHITSRDDADRTWIVSFIVDDGAVAYFAHDRQHQSAWFANRGYACLQVNYRGLVGYGKAFANAGIRKWAAVLHDDRPSPADQAARGRPPRPFGNPETIRDMLARMRAECGVF